MQQPLCMALKMRIWLFDKHVHKIYQRYTFKLSKPEKQLIRIVIPASQPNENWIKMLDYFSLCKNTYHFSNQSLLLWKLFISAVNLNAYYYYYSYNILQQYPFLVYYYYFLLQCKRNEHNNGAAEERVASWKIKLECVANNWELKGAAM